MWLCVIVLLVDVYVHHCDMLIIKVRAYFVNIYGASRLLSKKITRSQKVPSHEILGAQHLHVSLQARKKAKLISPECSWASITFLYSTNSNWISIPLDFTQLFSHFYSDNLKTPLTRTKFCLPWSKFTPLTQISSNFRMTPTQKGTWIKGIK